MGERLAVVVPAVRSQFLADQTTLLQVWDRAGSKLMELNRKEFPGQPKDRPLHVMPGEEWLEFVSESRLLLLGSGTLVAVDVPSGEVGYTLTGVKAPVALSPSRKWVCSATAAGGLKFFNTADGASAGEIPKYGKPSVAAFNSDGTALAVSYDSYFAIWDMATGKPTGAWPVPEYVRRARVDRPLRSITWFGADYLLFGNLLLERGQGIWLCEYNPAQLWVAWSSSPDGRLWAAGNFKEILGRWEDGKPVNVTPGAIADAGLQGKNLLAACTVPRADVKERLQARLSGIIFRPEDPARIEVTGSASTEAQHALADAAAEELAKRGKAVDPSAKAGVRIELSRAKREQIQKDSTVQFIGHPPPGALKDVYRIDAKIYLVNHENGSKCPATSMSLAIDVHEANWETVLCKGVGKQIGMSSIPMEGSWTTDGKSSGLPAEVLMGIDGVLP